MAKERSTHVPGMYYPRRCDVCKVADLNFFFHETTCSSDDAKVERSERMSDAEVLARVIQEWRNANPDPKSVEWGIRIWDKNRDGGWGFENNVLWRGSEEEAKAKAEAMQNVMPVRDTAKACPFKDG